MMPSPGEVEATEKGCGARQERRGRGNDGKLPSRSSEAAEKEGFYAQALTHAERVRLGRARQLQGLDDEIALLRVRLACLAAEHPDRTELLLKGMNTLIRAVATKYRLSPRAEEDLYQSVLGVVRGLGGVLWPEGKDGP